VALAIDASSPAIVSGAGPTVTTASFTPPAGSVLLIAAAMDGLAPAAGPSITDNLGGHLTYTRTDWQNGNGQAAIWWAAVSSSAAMTVSVTNGETGAGAQSTAAKVWVLTGADTVTPIGAHGPGTSSSAASIAQSYTASATSGWGFIGVSDFDQKGAESAGAGCTVDGSANIGTAITYGFARRTTADDVSGNSNSLNVTLPGTSTNLRWAYAEVKPAATAAVGDVAGPYTGPVPGLSSPTGQRRPFPLTFDTTGATVSGGATLAGSGVVADVAATQGAATTVAGAGVLSATGTTSGGGTASLVGTGVVAATVTISATCGISGAGAVVASTVQNAAVISAGAGTVAVSVVQLAPVTLTGAGSLSGGSTTGSTAGLAGAGSLAGLATQLATVAPAGAGVLTASGGIPGGGAASPSGAGVLSALATQRTTAAPAGTGALAGAVVQGGKATPTGAGVLAAAGVIAGSVGITGAGALTGAVRQLAGVAAAGAGVLTASAGGVVTGSAALVGAGVLTIDLNPCVTSRPSTGTTVRPGSGATTRPYTGVTSPPC
jgi:hypothetical protein